jgi:restriction system protein
MPRGVGGSGSPHDRGRERTGAALAEFVGIVVFGLVLVAFFVVRSPWFKGARGEAHVNSALRRLLDENDYQLFKDLTLPCRDGTTQVDHIVVSPFGVFVIETKNMKGWIYGGADQPRWTQVIYGHKSQFQNPIRQNYKHVKAVQDLFGLEAHQLHNVVVFVGSGIPKTAMPSKVVWGVRSLVAYIKSKGCVVVDQTGLERVAEGLGQSSLKSGLLTHRAHVRNVKRLVKQRRQQTAECPRCGGQLVERTNGHSGEQFLGCLRFPVCRGTRRLT